MTIFYLKIEYFFYPHKSNPPTSNNYNSLQKIKKKKNSSSLHNLYFLKKNPHSNIKILKDYQPTKESNRSKVIIGVEK